MEFDGGLLEILSGRSGVIDVPTSVQDWSSSSPTQVRYQDPQFRQQHGASTRRAWRFLRSGGSFTLEGLYGSS